MIVVFGSLIADLVFPVASLPRPGETVACPSVLVMPGGKGANQAVAAARTGATVRLAGRVGNDGFGDLLVDALKQSGVNVDAVGRADRPTGCAAVCVDADGQNQIALAAGANLEARHRQVKARLLGPRTTLVLQMEVAPEENWALIARAAEAGARIVLNAAPAGAVPAAALAKVDYLVVNAIESTMVAEAVGLRARSPAAAARRLAERFNVACVVTLGGGGAFACLGDGEWRIGALPIVAVDATAAGDAFVGVFAAGLDSGKSALESLHRASVAGGLTCLTAGAQPSLPTATDIDQWLASLKPPRRLKAGSPIAPSPWDRGRPAGRRRGS